jgi:hypothetical protein
MGAETICFLFDKVAGASGTSGKPYLIRFEGGEINSRVVLLAALKKLES